MYVQNQYNHPAFNKFHLGIPLTSKSGLYDLGGNKTSKLPEKPITPYMRYSQKVWENVKFNRPELKSHEISRVINMMWRDLPSEGKKGFVAEYENEKAVYQEALKNFHNSESYQSKSKRRNDLSEPSLEDNSFLFIEPTPSDANYDCYFSLKHLSTTRFHQNQRLMLEILTDCNVVQTGKSVVTTKRLNTLHRQVQSLEHHCDSLDNELTNLEKKHLASKRRWSEQTKKFLQKLNELSTMSIEEFQKKYKTETPTKSTTVVSESNNVNDTEASPAKKIKVDEEEDKKISEDKVNLINKEEKVEKEIEKESASKCAMNSDQPVKEDQVIDEVKSDIKVPTENEEN